MLTSFILYREAQSSYFNFHAYRLQSERSAVSEHDGLVFCCPLLYITLRGTILVYLDVPLSSPSNIQCNSI